MIPGEDGPELAPTLCSVSLKSDILDADAVLYALSAAVQNLREHDVLPQTWATFVHWGTWHDPLSGQAIISSHWFQQHA
jgi:hypothetical protein